MTRSRKYLLAPLALAAAAAGGAGCGRSAAVMPPAPHGGHGAPALCGKPIPPVPAATGGGTAAPAAGPVLDAAALYRAVVVVRAGATGPSCRVLTTGQTVVLAPGQEVQFVANAAPYLQGARSAVVVATRPGPSFLGPGETVPTRLVVVTVVAVRSGSAALEWTRCAGTAC